MARRDVRSTNLDAQTHHAVGVLGRAPGEVDGVAVASHSGSSLPFSPPFSPPVVMSSQDHVRAGAPGAHGGRAAAAACGRGAHRRRVDGSAQEGKQSLFQVGSLGVRPVSPRPWSRWWGHGQRTASRTRLDSRLATAAVPDFVRSPSREPRARASRRDVSDLDDAGSLELTHLWSIP